MNKNVLELLKITTYVYILYLFYGDMLDINYF